VRDPVHDVKELAAGLEDERASAASGFEEACKRVLPGLHVPPFEKIGNAAIEDTAVPKQVARGLPLVGDTPSQISRNRRAH
jgi:hypothetical protein